MSRGPSSGWFRRGVLVPALCGSVLLGGCAARNVELEPSPLANQVAGESNTARTSVKGVTFTVDGNAWSGTPDSITGVVPVQVSIDNKSGRSLRVQLEHISLVAPGGERFAALPPRQIEGTEVVSDRVTTASPGVGVGGAGVGPGWTSDRFWPIGPYATPYGLSPWQGPFTLDPTYYDTYYARWPVDLPTSDMLTRALPEGVIDNGGRLQGFVFFQDVPAGMEGVLFRAALIDAKTGERFGTAEIPFWTRKA